MRYYIVGDTGGHLPQLIKGLNKVGVDTENHVIPEDMTIIHLGDLIHKGPTSSQRAFGFVQRMQANNPGRWIQLVGNHEMQHILGGIRFWRCDCGDEFDQMLEGMFLAGDVQIAYGVKSVEPQNLTLSKRDTFVPKSKDWLFTHGGLTHDWWVNAHMSDSDVESLSAAINELPRNMMTSPGSRLGYPNNPASPVWASAPDEVFPGWNSLGYMPFNQAIGHTYIYNWEMKRWFMKPHKDLKRVTKINEPNRTTLTKIGDSLLVVADPGFESREPSIEAQPVIFIGEVK